MRDKGETGEVASEIVCQLPRVQPVVKALENIGVGCFLDAESIDPLADFPERIRTGVERSHALLTWWSKDYRESDICLQEFRRAWQHARRQSSDLERRIWVVNPETTAHHIFAGARTFSAHRR